MNPAVTHGDQRAVETLKQRHERVTLSRWQDASSFLLLLSQSDDIGAHVKMWTRLARPPSAPPSHFLGQSRSSHAETSAEEYTVTSAMSHAELSSLSHFI